LSGLGSLASTLLGGTTRNLCRELARRRPGTALAVAALTEPVARALGAAGHEAHLATLSDGRLDLDPSSVDAVCLSGLESQVLEAALGESARVAKDQALVFLAASRRMSRARVAALFLHAGFVDIEQRDQVTSGRVRR